jgi:hypothetical protein
MREQSPIEKQDRFFLYSTIILIVGVVQFFPILLLQPNPSTGVWVILLIMSYAFLLGSVFLFVYVLMGLRSKKVLNEQYDHLLTSNKWPREKYIQLVENVLHEMNWKFKSEHELLADYYRVVFGENEKESLVEIYVHEDIIRNQKHVVISVYPKGSNSTRSKSFEEKLDEVLVKIG